MREDEFARAVFLVRLVFGIDRLNLVVEKMRVIVGIRACVENGAGKHTEGDIRAKANRRRFEISGRNDDLAAAGLIRRINRRLNFGRLQLGCAGNCAEIYDIINLFHKSSSSLSG